MSLTEYILLIVGTILLLYFIIYYIDYKRKIKLKEKHQMFWIRRVVKKGTHKLKEILILIPLKKTIYISLGLILIIIIGLSFFQKSTINNYIEAKPLYNSYENFRTNDEVISYSNLMASDYLNLTQIQDDQVFLVENYNGNKIDELSQTTASTTRISETDHLLAIGHSSWNGDNDSRRTRSFRGDVAMFKVYNKLLTPVDMLANYNATSDNFNTAYTGFENGVVFEDEFGGQVEVSSLVSGQQVNANAKVINIDGSITSIYSILAIYDRGELVGIDIKPAAVSNGEANISNTLVPVNIKPEGVYEIKLFVWNDMATIKPILATEYCL